MPTTVSSVNAVVPPGDVSRKPAAVSSGRDSFRFEHLHLEAAKGRTRRVLKFSMESEPEITWPRLSAFMRQHTHDVRNGLNSLDLEAALLVEIVTDDESRESAGRVRAQLRSVADQLRAMSALFHEPQPYAAPLAARELMLIWREQLAALPEAPDIGWIEETGDEKVNVDATMMAAVFRELLVNARVFRDGGPATASVRREGDDVIFELREPKSKLVECEGWGRRVFETTKRGGYGLGLWNVQRSIEASGATIARRNDQGALVTRIVLPVWV